MVDFVEVPAVRVVNGDAVLGDLEGLGNTRILPRPCTVGYSCPLRAECRIVRWRQESGDDFARNEWYIAGDLRRYQTNSTATAERNFTFKAKEWLKAMFWPRPLAIGMDFAFCNAQAERIEFGKWLDGLPFGPTEH